MISFIKKISRNSALPIIVQTRSIRPNITTCKENFQIRIDVHDFGKDEIRVKAARDYVIIEGKQERKTETGYLIKKFCRKFKLPDNCNPDDVNSNLSDNGVLTIVAKRDKEINEYLCERLVPVKYCGPEEKPVKDCDSHDKPELNKAS